MYKNTADQQWVVFAFGAPEHATLAGLPVTGDAANITANLRIDGGSAAAITDTNPTELEDGYYAFDLSQAETNGDILHIAPASSTGDVIVVGVPGVVFTNDTASIVSAALVANDALNGNINGTVGDTGNTTSALHLEGLGATYANDTLNGRQIVVFDDSTGAVFPTFIEGWVSSTSVATLADTLPFTPENDTDTYVITPRMANSGAGLDAAGVRAALGMASADLDDQLDALPTAAEVVNEWETQSQANPTGFHVNVKEINDAAVTGDGDANPWDAA